MDHKLYPRKALLEARQAYKDYCKVEVKPTEDQLVEVSITPMPEYQEDSREVVLEFLNYVLDKAAQLQVE
jgi:hypothetical protein